MQTPLTPTQQKLLHTQCPVCNLSELSSLDTVAPDALFLYCPHCETTIDGNDVTYYMSNPDVCPSSLDEYGHPITEDNTAHRWDEALYPIECAECGTLKDQQ